MINRTRQGTRVRIKPGVVTFYRKYPLGLEGLIVSECENGVGRSLIDVMWIDGNQSPVFESDIELMEPDGAVVSQSITYAVRST